MRCVRTCCRGPRSCRSPPSLVSSPPGSSSASASRCGCSAGGRLRVGRAAPPSTLLIEVLRQILGGDVIDDTLGGHVDLGEPQQPVEEDPPLVDVAPVRVGVPAGEAEAASAVGPLEHPHHAFLLAGGG